MNVLRFTVPVPAAKKNSRILGRTKSGRPTSRPSRAAERSAEQIAGAAHTEVMALLGGEGRGKPSPRLFGRDEVAVSIVWRVDDERVDVEVVSCGPKPDSATARERDIDNLATTILDALQGVAYVNDSQVAMLQVERR